LLNSFYLWLFNLDWEGTGRENLGKQVSDGRQIMETFGGRDIDSLTLRHGFEPACFDAEVDFKFAASEHTPRS
jgi:hypothetical protein